MQILSSPPLICSFACINAKWLPVCFILLSKSSQRVVISNISSRLIRANSGSNSAFNYIMANWSSTADSSGSYPKWASAEWRLGSCWLLGKTLLPLGTCLAAGKHGAKEEAQRFPMSWFCRKTIIWIFCKSRILQQMQFADGDPINKKLPLEAVLCCWAAWACPWGSFFFWVVGGSLATGQNTAARAGTQPMGFLHVKSS